MTLWNDAPKTETVGYSQFDYLITETNRVVGQINRGVKVLVTHPTAEEMDYAHFMADLFFDIEGGILDALTFTTETGAVDELEYETTRG